MFASAPPIYEGACRKEPGLRSVIAPEREVDEAPPPGRDLDASRLRRDARRET